MNVKPGDLIEWTYRRDGKLVYHDDRVWSSVEENYVPIGRELTHLCISCEGEIITWLNEKGVFSACVDDTTIHGKDWTRYVVVPRKRVE
jgi:hypothetical protein